MVFHNYLIVFYFYYLPHGISFNMATKVIFEKLFKELLSRHKSTGGQPSRYRNQKTMSYAKGGTTRRGRHWETKKAVKKVAKRVSALSKKVESGQAVHTYRVRSTLTLRAAQNKNAQVDFSNGGLISQLETGANSLRYFNPATNSLISLNAAIGTYSRDLTASVYSKLTVRNNYQVPCECRVYLCRPKDDTSQAPNTMYNAGLVDQGNPAVDSPLMYPTDSEILKEMWSMKVTKKVLQPGQEMHLNHFIKSFQYDFAHTDSHSLDYQRKYNGYSWLIRIVGMLGHDTLVVGEQGQIPCGVDMLEDVTIKYFYDAGKDLKDFRVLDNASDFSNGGVVSSKPVSDNLAYSII